MSYSRLWGQTNMWSLTSFTPNLRFHSVRRSQPVSHSCFGGFELGGRASGSRLLLAETHRAHSKLAFNSSSFPDKADCFIIKWERSGDFSIWQVFLFDLFSEEWSTVELWKLIANVSWSYGPLNVEQWLPARWRDYTDPGVWVMKNRAECRIQNLQHTAGKIQKAWMCWIKVIC